MAIITTSLAFLLAPSLSIGGNLSTIVQEEPPPPLQFYCCAPAVVLSQPAGAGCNEVCFNDNVQENWDINCYRLAEQSSQDIADGACIQTSPNGPLLTCTMHVNACVIQGATLFICRAEAHESCAAGDVRCYWDNAGTQAVAYSDCSGSSCVVGAPNETACDSH